MSSINCIAHGQWIFTTHCSRKPPLFDLSTTLRNFISSSFTSILARHWSMTVTRHSIHRHYIILQISRERLVNEARLKQKIYHSWDQGNHCLWDLPIIRSNGSTRWKVTLVPCDKWHRSCEEKAHESPRWWLCYDRVDCKALVHLEYCSISSSLVFLKLKLFEHLHSKYISGRCSYNCHWSASQSGQQWLSACVEHWPKVWQWPHNAPWLLLEKY